MKHMSVTMSLSLLRVNDAKIRPISKHSAFSIGDCVLRSGVHALGRIHTINPTKKACVLSIHERIHTIKHTKKFCVLQFTEHSQTKHARLHVLYSHALTPTSHNQTAQI